MRTLQIERHRDIAHLLLILGAAVAVRALLYDQIAIRADLGYWLLDAQYVLEGQRPFVDFIGRSPVFHYAYASVAAVVGVSLASFRWFVLACWLVAGIGLYDLTRQARGHRAGLVAFALLALTPFTISFGFYSTSQSVGVLLAVAACVVVVRRPTTLGYGVAGALIGLGMMARQSMLLVGAALWTWQAIRISRTRDVYAGAVRAGSAALSGLVAVAAVSLGLALGDVTTAWRIFAVDVLALFWSAGSGGVPLLDMASEAVTGGAASNRAGLLSTLMDDRSLLALWAGLIAGVPFLLGIVPFARWASEQWLRPLDRMLVATIGLTVALIAGFRAVVAGYYVRVLWVAAAVALGTVIWHRPRLDQTQLEAPPLLVPTLAAVWVFVGYLVRPNLVATYYFMDVLPFLAPAAGVAVVAWLSDARPNQRWMISASVLLLVVASTAALSPLAALTTAQSTDRIGTMQPHHVDAMKSDMDERVGDDTILAMQPLYPSVSDARQYQQNSRALYLAHAFEGGGPMYVYYANLTEAMSSGEIEWVVHERATRQLLAYNATARETFEQCYEPVDADGTYQSLNHTLYRYGGC